MAKVKDMSVDDLEYFIEQKLLEIVGDPDSGLQLKEGFKRKLKQRINKPAKRVSHEEVIKKIKLWRLNLHNITLKPSLQ